MLKYVVCIAALLVSTPSFAASESDIDRLKYTLTPIPEMPGSMDRTITTRILGHDYETRVIVYFGKPVKEMSAAEKMQMKKDLKKHNMSWPLSPSIIIAFPGPMCVYALFDEGGRGTVTHAIQECSPWGSWIGEKSGPAHNAFKGLGGPQAVYDSIVQSILALPPEEKEAEQ